MSSSERLTAIERGDQKLKILAITFAVTNVMLWFSVPWLRNGFDAIAGRLDDPQRPMITVGVQELLVYFDPWLVYGVLPAVYTLGFVAIAFLFQPKLSPAGTRFGSIVLAILLVGFEAVWVFLIAVGILCRGPNWNFYWPWEPQVPRVVALNSVDFSQIFWLRLMGRAMPSAWIVREAPSLLLAAGYIAVGLLVARALAYRAGQLTAARSFLGVMIFAFGPMFVGEVRAPGTRHFDLKVALLPGAIGLIWAASSLLFRLLRAWGRCGAANQSMALWRCVAMVFLVQLAALGAGEDFVPLGIQPEIFHFHSGVLFERVTRGGEFHFLDLATFPGLYSEISRQFADRRANTPPDDESQRLTAPLQPEPSLPRLFSLPRNSAMHSNPQPSDPRSSSRREFLKTSTLVAGGVAAGNLLVPTGVHAADSETLKVGLIGCGGRGTGAAGNALAADPNIKITALADMFPDRLAASLTNLKQTSAAKIDVPAERQFTGFDAYKQLLATDVDVVILATPPHFRPMHLQAAVDAGKHIFCEKPVAVDAQGVRSVMETVEQARQKKLSLVSGLCYRYDLPKRETIKRIHDGAIGDIKAMHVSYNTGTLWHHGRKPEWSEMEYQLRNWLYFTWLSGDFNVEQHIHSLDKAAWAMKDEPPVRATGLGGRQVRTGEEWGHIFDHMSVVYEYANGTRLFSFCRQMAGCSLDVSDHLIGTKGNAEMMRAKIDGEQAWQYRGPTPNMYDVEHQELFASIRSASPINNGTYMARSTMMAIMGRMACYTGQTLTWEQCLNSKEDLRPDKYELGPMPTPTVAKPGLTAFV